jgi:hypothetical protein
MRRKILIFLGLLVALLPYLGFPYDYNKWVWTTAGFLIVFLVLLPRTPKIRRLEERFDAMSRSSRVSQEDGGEGEPQRSLHVEQRETEDRGGVHIERETIVDTKHIEESLPPVSPDVIDTIVERKVSVVRRRKKAESTPPSTFSDYASGNT